MIKEVIKVMADVSKYIDYRIRNIADDLERIKGELYEANTD